MKSSRNGRVGHHVLQYVRQYEERMHQLGRYGPGHGSADTTGESPNVLDATRLRKVHEWRQKRIVPEWVVTWHHYEKWRDEQERLFRSFAIQNGLFTPEELDANRQYQERTDSHEMNSRQCRLM
ncbi:NADH dehydrogenase 1 alpha subcomplex subunit 6 ndufa6 [Cyanidiococcus yangmingshanensis]|uniref:NADH dehydrogenase 1 alpha subcomplex subunit 6 ndufa6 n=1 Tax=Cyanidiococcus yangmingshanensis TaxID=2690220 RepID=A0A7J7IGQ7_9RHOD|nr:NADH dehydrogenase 1 alpha subcomplex subunit 6 ndufa6 [Cyanidiococcus yangmingshanensis]